MPDDVSGSSSATGTPSSRGASTRCSPRSASRPSARRCAHRVRTHTRSGSCVPSARSASTSYSSYHDDTSSRCLTSTSGTTTKHGHTVVCCSPSRSPARLRRSAAAPSLVAMSSTASSTSTTGLPDHTSLTGILGSATAPLLPRTPLSVTGSTARARQAIPLTRNPPSLLHTSTETAPLRVFEPFRDACLRDEERNGKDDRGGPAGRVRPPTSGADCPDRRSRDRCRGQCHPPFHTLHVNGLSLQRRPAHSSRALLAMDRESERQDRDQAIDRQRSPALPRMDRQRPPHPVSY